MYKLSFDKDNVFIEGIKEIDSIEEKCIILYTENDRIELKGKNFNTTRLDTETGIFQAAGMVMNCSIIENAAKKAGIISRLLK